MCMFSFSFSLIGGHIVNYLSGTNKKVHLDNVNTLLQVAILLLYSQYVAFQLASSGHRGLRRIIDYTVQLLADTASNFIINHGGWVKFYFCDCCDIFDFEFSQLQVFIVLDHLQPIFLFSISHFNQIVIGNNFFSLSSYF